MVTIKKMEVAEFWEQGYLQELNRHFLHPLGLALEIVTDDEGNVSFGKIWNYREDPEGMVFLPETISSEEFIRKAKLIEIEWDYKTRIRKEALGYVIQPVGEIKNEDG